MQKCFEFARSSASIRSVSVHEDFQVIFINFRLQRLHSREVEVYVSPSSFFIDSQERLIVYIVNAQ